MANDRRARAALVVALSGPFLACVGLGGGLADHLAIAIAERAVAVSSMLADTHPAEPTSVAIRGTVEPAMEVTAAPAADASTPSASIETAPLTTGGIFVPRGRLQALIEAGARPASGGHAPATSWRPAGTILVGVGGLGAGLRDGDVVTRVGGAPATSPNAVVGAVDAALRARAPAISAEIWRGRQRLSLTVELPEAELDRRRPGRRRKTATPR